MSEYVYATNGTPVSDADGEISLPRERIVRCRDCKHYGLGRRCGWSRRFVKPDGFCAWGEREVEQR